MTNQKVPAAATDGTPKTVEFRGDTLTLPGHLLDLVYEMPLDWQIRLQRLDFAPLAEAICVAANFPFDASMRMREAVELVTDAMRAYGLDVGESVASPKSSVNTGMPSRPTSKKPTGSTSKRPGTAKK
jgi:hypothetical protein